MYTHLDLFSGIGGFALGLQRTGKFKTIAFCEYDEFCHRVLRKNFGNVPIIKDIKSFDTERFIHEHGRPFIITGGFPCQPFSQAGLRQGTEDEKGRDLWSEMHRVISDLKAQWVIGENVSGFATLPLVFERTATDLEASGYQTVCFNIPACATNLKHERQRLWIVAHANGNSQSNDPNDDSKGKWLHDVSHSNSIGWHEVWNENRDTSESGNQKRETRQHQRICGDVSNANSIGTQSWETRGQDAKDVGQSSRSKEHRRRSFEPRLGGKLSDGLSDRMDESEFGVPRVTTEKQDRAARLKAIGNAVIPTIPEIIARAIIEAEGD